MKVVDTSKNSEGTVAVLPVLLYTVPQFMSVTGLSRTTVYGLMKSGELETIRVGRCRRIPAAAVARWLDTKMSA
jgi:excisionase family DNA binding protein